MLLGKEEEHFELRNYFQFNTLITSLTTLRCVRHYLPWKSLQNIIIKLVQKCETNNTLTKIYISVLPSTYFDIFDKVKAIYIAFFHNTRYVITWIRYRYIYTKIQTNKHLSKFSLFFLTQHSTHSHTLIYIYI